MNDSSKGILYPRIGPFIVYEFNEFFVLNLSDECTGISENYRDCTNKYFWHSVEYEIFEIHPLKNRLTSIELDDSSEIVMRVNHISLQNVKHILHDYGKYSIASSCIRILDDHIQGIKIFMKYSDKYGIEKAENMLYLYSKIR